MSNANNSIEVRKPDAFDGNKEKSSQFLAQVQMYILGNEEKFPNEKKKIIFMISYMNLGDAKFWADLEFKDRIDQQVRQEALSASDRAESESPWVWKTFLESFHARFDDVGLLERSYAELKAMGDRPMENISEYVSKFRTLIAKAEITEEKTKVFLFSQGLSPAYYIRIRNNHVPAPTTAERWYEIAEQYYIEYQGRKTKGRGNSEDPRRPQPYQGRPPFQRRVPRRVQARVSEAETREKNLCFYCEKPGHVARDCPNKAKRPSVNLRRNTDRSSRGPFRPTPPYRGRMAEVEEDFEEDEEEEAEEPIGIQARFASIDKDGLRRDVAEDF